jgi:hypothetical protein
MHLFRACAFVAQLDGKKRARLEQLEHREVVDAWKATQKATNAALGLVQSELGLQNMNVLWSGALLVPLIALCTVPARERDAGEMIGWLALAAMTRRYSGSAESLLDRDLRACRARDPIGELLKNLRSSGRQLRAVPSDFAGTLSDRSGLLALYIACKHRGIRDFYTGAKVLLRRDIDRHHILPRAQFPAHDRARADSVANVAFILVEVNKAISHAGPEVYLKGLSSEVRASQCIPEDPELWSIESASAFWTARRHLLAQAFNDFLRSSLPKRRGVGRA